MVVVSGNGTAVTGLGGASGYGEIMLSQADDASLRVNVGAVFENGFQFGAEHFAANDLYVSTNGLISFGAAVNGVQSSLAAITRPFIAAFHADVDTRLDGEGPESGPVWVDVDPASDVVTITWQDVGFYRRNASFTNTFQLQLYDLGEDGIAIVLRYEEVAWVSGDMQGGWQGLGGDPALIGWRLSSSGAVTEHWASGNEGRLLALSDALGNTGVAGLWVHEYLGPRVINGASANETLTGSAGADAIYGGSGNDSLRGLGAADALHGDTGFDLADYSQAATAVVVNLANSAANAGADAVGDTYFSMEGVIGGGFSDLLIGNDAANRLLGGAGNDRLQAGAGSDTVYGGAGNDTILAGGGADHYSGDSGTDRVDYGDANAGVTVDRALPDQSTGIAAGDRFSGIEVIAGSAFGDKLSGWRHADIFLGSGGNDRLSGRDGDDSLYGDTGRDTLIGGNGADLLNGGAELDLAGYGSATTAIRADLAQSSQNLGADALGDQYIGIEGLYGSRFNDSLAGNSTANWLSAAAGHDWLFGRVGDDTLIGGAGNDVLEGGSGADLMLGGTGMDRASYASAASGVVADLARPEANRGEARGDLFTGIEEILGSAHDDRLSGHFSANLLLGGAGNDALQGRGGADRLYGGSGFDLASYEAAEQGVRADLGLASRNTGEALGDDYFEIEGLRGSVFADDLTGDLLANFLDGGGGNDQLNGGAGNDTLRGGSGGDRLVGGEGMDLVSYVGASAAVLAHMAAPLTNLGEASGDSFDGIEGLVGSDYNDTLTGAAGDDWLYGGAGRDVLAGARSMDRLFGGDGDDVLIGGARADRLDGGAGIDWADYTSDENGLTADLANPGTGTGDALGDTYLSIEALRGSQHNDSLFGDSGANQIEGLSGVDRLYGRDGNDRLDGGSGGDWLTGGTGADTFLIRSLSEAGDYVADYRPSEGDGLEIAVSGVTRSSLEVRFQTIAGQGQPGTAEALIIYKLTGQVLFTLTDAAGLTDLFLRIGTTSYDLL